MKTSTKLVNAIAGCCICGGEMALWDGPKAAIRAMDHHETTGHQTWLQFTEHRKFGESKEKNGRRNG